MIKVTDSMSAMGVGIDDLQGYLDVIVTTNNKANTTAADLMDAFIGCGGAARAAGMNYKGNLHSTRNLGEQRYQRAVKQAQR